MAAEGTEEQLRWEARRRPGAALAALLAGVLIFAGALWGGIAFSDAPHSGVVEALDRAQRPGPVGGQPSLRVAFYEFYDDHSLTVLLSALLRGVGLVGLGWALTFLGIATRHRRPQLPRAALYLPGLGAGLSALAVILSTIGTVSAVNDFLDGPRTIAAADDVSANGLIAGASLLNFPALLALALALVLIALNAMRAGLLTRFMGVLGVITGVLLIIPIGSPLPVIQCFWLVLLSVLLAGRWPAGQPPAWRTGRAEPWPSAAEVREQRQRAYAGRRGARAEPEPEGEPEPVAAAPGAARSKRKRKRRG